MPKKILNYFFRPIVSLSILIAVSIVIVALTKYVVTSDVSKQRLAELGTAPLQTEVLTDIMSLKVESVREDL